MVASEHNTNIVVVAVLHRDGKIFVAKRADSKIVMPGKFELVGGHVEPGEALEVALVREVEEEVGLRIVPGKICCAFTYKSEDIFKVEICYLAAVPEGQEPNLNPEDHSDGLWVARGEYEEIESDNEETLVINKAFEILQGVK